MAVGANHARPRFVQFNRCRNALIENVRIRNSPFRKIDLLRCDSGRDGKGAAPGESRAGPVASTGAGAIIRDE